MSEVKTSFVLYADLMHTVNHLPNEEAGVLFKHILSFVNGEDPATEDVVINVAFEPIKQHLNRDWAKYSKSVSTSTPRKEVNIKSTGSAKNIEEVTEYFKKVGIPSYEANSVKFFNHYEANGWMRGNTKVVDWKALSKTWSFDKQKTIVKSLSADDWENLSPAERTQYQITAMAGVA